jgi:hypothetical protein
MKTEMLKIGTSDFNQRKEKTYDDNMETEAEAAKALAPASRG